ncbi:unnamed protein product, partial [Iphiclides podalirius]
MNCRSSPSCSLPRAPSKRVSGISMPPLGVRDAKNELSKLAFLLAAKGAIKEGERGVTPPSVVRVPKNGLSKQGRASFSPLGLSSKRVSGGLSPPLVVRGATKWIKTVGRHPGCPAYWSSSSLPRATSKKVSGISMPPLGNRGVKKWIVEAGLPPRR